MADSSASGQLADKTRALVVELWERSLPRVKARLELLDQAAAAVPLSEKLRLDARNVAHQFSGSLGMFGFAQGTQIAHQLELALDRAEPDSERLAVLTRQLRQELFPEGPPAML